MVDWEARAAQDLKIHKFHPKPVHFREGTPSPEQEGSLSAWNFTVWRFGSLVFPANREGLFLKQRPAPPASRDEELQALASHSALLSLRMGRPVPCHLLFGHGFGCSQGFASVQEDKCHLWGNFLPQGVFATDFWRLVFWGGETRSSDGRARPLSSLLLQNLFSKERSTGIAAWPLIPVAFSFNPSYKK